jgi:hypothetical protein
MTRQGRRISVVGEKMAVVHHITEEGNSVQALGKRCVSRYVGREVDRALRTQWIPEMNGRTV